MGSVRGIVMAAGLLALGGCGGGGADDGAGAAVERPEVDLEVRASRVMGGSAAGTLRCSGERSRATGFLARRSAARLCRRARELADFLASEPPADRICTGLYGGPSRAVVRGRIGDRSVERRLQRRNGCEIADWDRAQLLLPRPVPAS